MPSGELATPTAVAALCRELARDAASGTLRLEGPSGVARLGLASGELWWAESPAAATGLGERLLDAGLVDRADLAELAAGDGGPGGLILAVDEAGAVARDVLELFVREQLFEAVLELLAWSEGTWSLTERVPERRPPVTEPVPELLMEVSRRRSEWEQLAPVVAGPDAVPSSAADGAAVPAPLQPEEFTVVANVDGRRSVRRLAADLGQEPFAVARTVYGLALLGVVAVRPGAAADVPAGGETGAQAEPAPEEGGPGQAGPGAGAPEPDRQDAEHDPWAGVASEADEPPMWVADDTAPPGDADEADLPGTPARGPREPAASAGRPAAGPGPSTPGGGEATPDDRRRPAADGPETAPDGPERTGGPSHEPAAATPGGDPSGQAAPADAEPSGDQPRRRRSAGEVSELMRELSRLSQDGPGGGPRPARRTGGAGERPDGGGGADDQPAADDEDDADDDGDGRDGGRGRRRLFGWGG